MDTSIRRGQELIGREILINNEKYTVIGVMPAGFHFDVKNGDIWTPMAFTSNN